MLSTLHETERNIISLIFKSKQYFGNKFTKEKTSHLGNENNIYTFSNILYFCTQNLSTNTPTYVLFKIHLLESVVICLNTSYLLSTHILLSKATKRILTLFSQMKNVSTSHFIVLFFLSFLLWVNTRRPYVCQYVAIYIMSLYLQTFSIDVSNVIYM